MAVLETIPGMQPGQTKRNLAVATGYILLFPLILAVGLLTIPFVAGYAVGQNRNGLAERFDRLPGISSTGGITAGFAAFVYVVIAMTILTAALPVADQTEAPAGNASLAGGDGTNASVEAEQTAVSPTVTDPKTPTSTAGNEQDEQGDDSPSTSHEATVTPTIQSTPSLTERPTLSETATPSLIATDTVTSSSTPTVTPSATATATPQPTEPNGERTATVLRVVDGDTLKVRLDNGTEDTIRLLGVDTPEVHSENTPEEWEGVPNSEAGKECLRQAGHEASDWMKTQVGGETIRFTFDENEGKRGYYGRLLAYVYFDDRHLNYQLITRGDARVYDSTFEKRSSFYAAESDAQDKNLRAWSCRSVASSTPTPTPTADSSGNSGQLAVERVHEDAEGNDHENENDEYVVFKNTGESELDLSGWTVSDEKDHRYTVPSGFTLDAGATVTLYTGSGPDSEHELYWGSDSAIWNNSGDTIYVRTDDGDQVIVYEY